ncbi:AAA family ATPase [Crenobacter sp. SG2303]|uniref:AAA family ATPase n=1 Tax=Crenobacter oryzisoli TaxID=3056844 RepID=A0ABT7XR94_9NEIS|nr:AAA family ATPase [Crenobacter sp. SG2303]MDN0076250.1 AAA family ATPase [Crenobacter sp. SG2303]
MEIIAVINYKGGVGKTTVTANIGAELAFRGKKVLIIDTDAQASLTFSFVRPDYWDESLKDNKTIKSWFDAIAESDEPPPLASLVISPEIVNNQVDKNGGKLDLISSHLGLINVDLELATLLGGANLQQTKKNYIKVHGRLRQAVKDLASMNYDYVLIDCPPNFNIVTKNAIIASEKILIPAKPDYLSTLGIDYLQRSLNELVREFNEFTDQDKERISPEVLGVIFTMIQITSGQPIAAQRQFIAQTKRDGIVVFENYFRENKTIFADAPQNLRPVVLTAYSNATHSDIVDEIEAVVNEFEGRLGDI